MSEKVTLFVILAVVLLGFAVVAIVMFSLLKKSGGSGNLDFHQMLEDVRVQNLRLEGRIVERDEQIEILQRGTKRREEQIELLTKEVQRLFADNTALHREITELQGLVRELRNQQNLPK